MSTTHELPETLYRADEVRELDRCAIEDFGIPALTLMERAGQAVFAIIQREYPKASSLAVMCGSGNNGGDGYVVAALASKAGMDVVIYHMGSLEKLSPEARQAAASAEKLDIGMLDLLSPNVQIEIDADLVVDALLGIGVKGVVRSYYQGVIESINGSGAPVVSIDIPSGLCADTGSQMGSAVKANVTITFIGVKQGLLTGRGPALTGDLYFDNLQVPELVYDKVEGSSVRVDLSAVAKCLPRRERDAHKGRFGHVLVIGGDHGMAGAVIMAAEAAARVGAGLVSVVTRHENCPAIVARSPEIMAHGIDYPDELKPFLDRATTIVIGPGLGRHVWGRDLLTAALRSRLPLVIDADALSILSRSTPAQTDLKARRVGWVLTPHPGEAGKLIGEDNLAVQQNRFACVEKIQKKYQGVVVLKGAGTLIADSSGKTCMTAVGNPGMATGGMGDVLSGVIGGLIAQGIPLAASARVGAIVHGVAADICGQNEGERGMMATDLLPVIRHLINGIDEPQELEE